MPGCTASKKTASGATPDVRLAVCIGTEGSGHAQASEAKAVSRNFMFDAALCEIVWPLRPLPAGRYPFVEGAFRASRVGAPVGGPTAPDGNLAYAGIIGKMGRPSSLSTLVSPKAKLQPRKRGLGLNNMGIIR